VIDPRGRPEPQAPASSSWALHGVRLSARIIAARQAERGGDWCEAFAVGEGAIALSIGDVCGHGEQKYETMVAVRGAIRTAAQRGFDPAQTLAEAHRFLRVYDPEEYATALFAWLHVRRGKMAVANAGHPAPLVCGEFGAAFLEHDGHDQPLGIGGAFVPALRHIDIPEASLIVFYTDGVTEHDRKPLHGEAELRDAALVAYKFAALPAASVIEKQMHLTGANDDDVAILTAWTPPALRHAAHRNVPVGSSYQSLDS
jgi:serine phosphatase RsbU (regulator of sigma subunit)